jgi:soluble lytic murein transglycosylase-like protein
MENFHRPRRYTRGKRLTLVLAAFLLLAGWGASAQEKVRLARLTEGLSRSFVSGRWIDGERRIRYRHQVQNFSHSRKLDPRLVEAVVAVESNFNPRAVSRKGAAGLMQLMPRTAKRYGVENRFDPIENLAAGTRHLRSLLDRYGGSLELALAAYNAGESAVERYGGVPPYPETRDYVKKVLALYYKAARPPDSRFYRYEDETGRICISNAVPAGARNISPVVFTRRTNF